MRHLMSEISYDKKRFSSSHLKDTCLQIVLIQIWIQLTFSSRDGKDF